MSTRPTTTYKIDVAKSGDQSIIHRKDFSQIWLQARNMKVKHVFYILLYFLDTDYENCWLWLVTFDSFGMRYLFTSTLEETPL